ncbi:MAG: hypothetical protein KGD59_05995 [Candidatus Heimdallarchaeota archaeon]|nr:hypothetical protein [Candidatus Heimdallarchaeota archaeon]MBY8994084.1 hypothetical protein [Candidatus Heimdallarchaeota archaeon]
MSKPILYCGIGSAILAIASIIFITRLSTVPAVMTVFILILIITCPTALTILLIAYMRGKSPPDIQTKIEFIKSQYKSFRLKDASKTYICMVCKQDIELREDVHNCPNCHSYYHEDHLFQWLQVNTTCPVCSFDYYQNALKTRKKKK